MLLMYLAMIDSPEEKTKFVALYEKYRKLMFYAANDILKNDTLAEDAVQDAFLRIAKNMGKVGEVESARTKRFVLVIVENAAKSLYRKERNHFFDEEYSDEVFVQQYDDQVITSVRGRELINDIMHLPEKQRWILYLYEIYGYKYREIASLLGMTDAGVRKQAQRARETLRKQER